MVTTCGSNKSQIPIMFTTIPVRTCKWDHEYIKVKMSHISILTLTTQTPTCLYKIILKYRNHLRGIVKRFYLGSWDISFLCVTWDTLKEIPMFFFFGRSFSFNRFWFMCVLYVLSLNLLLHGFSFGFTIKEDRDGVDTYRVTLSYPPRQNDSWDYVRRIPQVINMTFYY